MLVPDPAGLATADVFAEADRLGLAREEDELRRLRGELLGAAAARACPLDYPELLVNDLTAAAVSLRPSIEAALTALREAGADVALMTGSGPTVAGLFRDEAAAAAAAARLGPDREAILTRSGIIR